ncbi:hypothetical protein BMF94_0242 [Rhodotorula taiwanensis]|uniref:EH domain-containing protein n=1 Tax=Rhodotorula taiwanensis TaxID=741276 RepID=A0A2S5BIR3_9BASI|nr:hypothetical protein BMF94_0242 [Rhodotorula taiwanensis]
MQDSTAASLSLKDRIRQLEQAAQSPLAGLSSSVRPTSSTANLTGINPPPGSTRLSSQPVEQSDDPLQSGRTTEPYAATRSNAASVPPPKPPRPVWVSKAKGDTVAQGSDTTRAEATRVSAERTEPPHGNEQANPPRLPTNGTVSRPATIAEASTASKPISQKSGEATLHSSTSAPKPELPSRPPKPPSLSASLDSTSTTSIRNASSPSPISQSSKSASAATPAQPAPGLPPRPAWARKQSPSPAPADNGAILDAGRSAPLSGSRQVPSGTVLTRRDTTSTVKSVSSTGSLQSLQGPPSASPRPSPSPALPPRPRWTPPTSKPATEAPAPARTGTVTSNGGEPDADGARAARKRYDRLFERCLGVVEAQYGSTGGRLDGRVVVELWRRSRLDDVQLRQIWNDVSTPDSRRTGGLDREEFARGMTAIDAELRRRWHK